MRHKLISTLSLCSILTIGGCASNRVPGGESKLLAGFPEMLAKQTLQSESSVKLPVLSVIRSTGRANRTEFVLPTGLGYSPTGDLFISDNNGQTIHQWSTNSDQATVFLSKKAVGLLEFPNAIQHDNDRVFVADNAGIKVFSAKGELENLIRTYLTVFSFVITPKGTILLNPIIRGATAEDPLIVELDAQGKRIRGFGLRHAANNNMFEDRGFLALGENKLFVGFKYRRTVEVYDIESGSLINTINIEHPVLNRMSSVDVRPSGSGVEENLTQPRYVAGIKLVHDKLFVCLHLPQPEILEFSHDGQPLAHFRVPVNAAGIDIFGFEARDDGGHTRLAIGVLEPGWSSTIYEVKTL